ncbi:MAG TPA: hypothetical protein DCS93_20755 [Microscillaceae bacterium]|nr:hypothetical protein [Microscillaceae bacterium]
MSHFLREVLARKQENGLKMRILGIVCMVVIQWGAFEKASAQKLLKLNQNSAIVDIASYVGFLKDSANQFTIQDILNPAIQKRFQLNTKATRNYGNGGAIWFKILIQATPGRYILELNNASVKVQELYHAQPDGSFKITKKGVYAQRPIKATSPLFKVQINNTQPQLLYFRCFTEKTLMLPLYMGTPTAFIEKNHQKDLLHGAYFGLMLIMILYNLFIYLRTREVAYLYYVLYALNLTLMIAIMAGHAQEFLWPNHPEWDNYGRIPIIFIGVFTILFANRFLYTKRYAPQLRKLSYWLFVPYMIVIVLGFFALNEAIKLLRVVALLTIILMIVTGVVVALKKYEPARLYLLGWGCVLVSGSLIILGYANILPIGIDSIFLLELGSTGEVLLFSLALADRINFYRKEKEAIQQENERIVKEQNEFLEQEVAKRTREIEQQKEEIIAQSQVLSTSNQRLHLANTKVKSSIQYAKRIQLALLPMQKLLAKKDLGFFVLYKPRDIVSGDFYWFAEIEGKNQLIVAVGDCTGHGVPGAFMTIMGNNFLNQIIKENKITSPGKILSELDEKVIDALGVKNSKHGRKKRKVQDGMDIAFTLIDFDERKMIFSGAKRPLYYFRNHELEIIKGSRYPIGSSRFAEKAFEEHVISFKKGDAMYLFSDGYPDQFGGGSNTKFMLKNFKTLLKTIEPKPMPAQKETLEKTLEEWKGTQRQTDDILVLGVRF